MCLRSHKCAEVLTADASSAFEEAGIDDLSAVQKVGRRFRVFRDTVLAFGGGRFPGEVFKVCIHATSCDLPMSGFPPHEHNVDL